MLKVGDLVEVRDGEGGWGMIVGWFDRGDGCDRLHPMIQFFNSERFTVTDWAHIENCEVISCK